MKILGLADTRRKETGSRKEHQGCLGIYSGEVKNKEWSGFPNTRVIQ